MVGSQLPDVRLCLLALDVLPEVGSRSTALVYEGTPFPQQHLDTTHGLQSISNSCCIAEARLCASRHTARENAPFITTSVSLNANLLSTKTNNSVDFKVSRLLSTNSGDVPD